MANQQDIELLQNKKTINAIDRWPLYFHLFCAIICMLTSTIFHMFKDMSHKAYMFYVKFDYIGIVILIGGSSSTPLYYAFYCDELKI